MMRKLALGLMMAGLFLMSGSLSPLTTSEAQAAPRFRSYVYGPIISRYCTKCHRTKYKRVWKKVKVKGKTRRKRIRVVTKKPAGKLDLYGWKTAYKNMVGVDTKEGQEGYQIVYAGDPSLSYIVFKLLGQHKQVGGKGTRCPKKRKLATWRVQRIIKWIKAGAKK